MRQAISCISLLLSLAVPAEAQTTPPTTSPTTAPVDSRQALRVAREAEKAGILKQLAGYPNLPSVKLADVLILGLRGGHLTLQTRLPPTTMPSRLDISDLPGICTLTLRQVGQADKAPIGNAPYEPDLFLLERYRFDEPDSTVSCMTVEALPTSVQLAWSCETLTGISEVTLVEQVGPTGVGADQVPANIFLCASDQPAAGDAAETHVDLKAPDFQTLRREHPAEVEKYLGPIIRELRSEAVLLPSDTALAWQVFFDEAKPNPQLEGPIRKLVNQLDADDSTDRSAARRALEAIGPAVAVELARLDRTKLSPEQTSAIEGLMRKFKPVSAETARRLAGDPQFLIECLNDTDEFSARTAFARLQKLSGMKLDFDFSTRDQARRDAVKKLRRQFEQAGPHQP